MFDVPPPHESVRGIDAYRETWPQFFEWQSTTRFPTVDDDPPARLVSVSGRRSQQGVGWWKKKQGERIGFTDGVLRVPTGPKARMRGKQGEDLDGHEILVWLTGGVRWPATVNRTSRQAPKEDKLRCTHRR
jgi:hypothetical protein